MHNDSSSAPPPSRPRPPFLRRRVPALALSIGIFLSAGVVLAQVLQQPSGSARTAAAVPQPAAPAPAPAPVKLDLVTVQKGDLQATVEAAGKLQLYQYVDVSPQIGGQVKDVLVAVGDTVKAGALLVEITPTVQPSRVESQRAQMARLQAELADQRAQLDYAELQFKRQTQLKAQNATREEAFESSKMNLSSATARVDSINAQIRQVEANLKIDEDSRQHAQVAAPMAGTVVSLNAHAGQLVGTGQGQAPLLRIADQSKLTVQARVAEADVTRLRKGMSAQFSTPGYPGQQLMSGMSAQVHFVVGQASDTLLLPARALGTPDADGWYSVTVVDAARTPALRRIKTGLRNAQQVQVLSGLSAGEQVLVGKMPAPAATAATAVPVKGAVAS